LNVIGEKMNRIVFYVALLLLNVNACAQDLFVEKHLPMPGLIFHDCPDCPEMVVIPAGNFDMGSDAGEDEEKPVHRVTFSRIFAMAKTEVTQGQWRAIMGASSGSCGDDCPAEQISWDEAQDFIRRLNQKTGQQYRLPSESEWEYACRAGGVYEYCGGDHADDVAWHDHNSGKKTHPVAGKQANAFGLFDMSGNVWEWVEDSSHDNYKGAPADGGEWLGDGIKRGLRGGSWADDPQTARATNRYSLESADDVDGVGFRLVRPLP
jgi:formylglycine-generating enzyme required for sulfatase activity